MQELVVNSVLRDVPKRHYDPCPAILEMAYRHKLEFLMALAKEIDA